MRYIDDMLKMIPLDEMGGTDMRDNNEMITSEAKAAENRAEIKVRRGTAGIVAAALILTLGAGAVMLARAGKDTDKPLKVEPGASQSQPVDDEALAEADAQAKKAYESIKNYCSCLVAEGYVNEIEWGSWTIEDLSAPGEQFSKYFTPLKAEWAGEGEFDYSYTPDMPESGQLFFVIDENRLAVSFVQWRADKGGVVGQYVDTEYFENTRTAFGTAPAALETENRHASEKTDEAYELYTVLNGITGAAEDWEYPDKMEWYLLPDQYILLDFDKREQYADLIYLIEKRAGRSFTGQAYVGLHPSMARCTFVEWRADENSELEYWPPVKDESVEFGKPIRFVDFYVPSIDEAISDPDDFQSPVYTIGCDRVLPRANGFSTGVIAYRTEIPEVEEWYEDFLTHNYEPVAFDESKKTAAADMGLLVKFNYIDVNRREYVYIRTSDMEGANIYVNGRYYNVEDNSVLDLLEDGLPESVDGNTLPAYVVPDAVALEQ